MVRSAARLGHGDLGVNRKRVEALRQRLDGAAGEFELLGQPAGELEALRWIVGVCKTAGVADSVETLVVERCLGEVSGFSRAHRSRYSPRHRG